MREKNRIKAKITFLLTALAVGWPCGFVLAAGGYYLTGMKASRMAIQFVTVNAILALILALVSGIPFMMMTENRIRDGIMPIDTYRREHNNFLCFMPQIAAVQLIACAVLVALRYGFAAAGVAVLLGSIDTEIDLLAGALLSGLLGGMAVVKMAHYMMMMKSSTMDTEARLRNGGKQHRPAAGPKEAPVDRKRHPEPKKETIKAEEEEPAEKETAEKENKPRVKIDVPAFEIPKLTRSGKQQEFKAPQPKRKAEKETPTEEFDLPKEPRRYAPDAKTGVLPDMETMGLEFEDLDDM